MKVLVTGCAGFIGSHLLDRCLSLGWSVTGVDDLSTGCIENISQQLHLFDFLKADVCDNKILEKISSNTFDVIFHLAARPRVSYSLEYPSFTNDENVGKTVRILDTLRFSKKTRFIFASSSSVYGAASIFPTPVTHSKFPRSPYALQKSICEDYCSLFSELYDIDTLCLRYFNVFGRRQRGDHPYATVVCAWIYSIIAGNTLRLDGDGEQTRDYSHIENIVEANVLAAMSLHRFNGQCLNVGCSTQTSNNEILKMLEDRFGVNSFSVRREPSRLGDVKRSCADVSETLRLLSYVPKRTFLDGFSELCDDAEKEIFERI